MKYRYRCPVCGKLFYRSYLGLVVLRTHITPWRLPCPGSGAPGVPSIR